LAGFLAQVGVELEAACNNWLLASVATTSYRCLDGHCRWLVAQGGLDYWYKANTLLQQSATVPFQCSVLLPLLSWCCCRWLVAVRRSPDGLLQQLASTWSGGLPGPAAAALAAAAGLAAGGVLGEGQLQEMMTAMQALVSGSSR
jgi:hypothetical protein